jgi:hypothetical protein
VHVADVHGYVAHVGLMCADNVPALLTADDDVNGPLSCSEPGGLVCRSAPVGLWL